MENRRPSSRAKAVPARGSYRHGDLRRALLEAGLALAAEGGPEAVVLREATRRAGVAPNAAYRHFAGRQDLLEAVRRAAVAAMAEGMEAQMAALAQAGDAAQQARARLRAVGAGYLRFARTQTGLFRTAFGGSFTLASSGDPDTAGRSGMDPFQHLGHALDLLVAAGLLPAARRPGAEFLAWSTVHGLALLVIDGPLRGLAPEQVDGLAQRLLDMVERGL
ncbi:TetR-like C-terminal domain-containing protein [Pseudorhodoferax sp.]|uniref:TetR-like C-terminal domain-containing protein n=1 Tax=Pseudorhodoferax sp. TaxID=1993553 RepID=UPI002DD64942|nr:TetR-like C-terminal domain-containing protein [Pseudorhodoferax sp.]